MSREAEIRRAQLAQEVLENDEYKAAWQSLEDELIRQWRASRNADDREQIHRLLLAHTKARTVLEGVMRSGEIDAANLVRERTRAESQVAYLAGRNA